MELSVMPTPVFMAGRFLKYMIELIVYEDEVCNSHHPIVSLSEMMRRPFYLLRKARSVVSSNTVDCPSPQLAFYTTIKNTDPQLHLDP
jgi:hypothetical protein